MKENNPLVSIAIATYNGEKYIAEQINSILAQSYENLEVVVVDDCSTDQTVEILKKFQKLDQRIQIHENSENLGFNANFNKALALTSGNYIAISDQDDIWDIEKIAYLLDNINSDLLLYHDSILIDENGNLKGKKISDLHRFVKGNCEGLLLYQNVISGHACLIHRDLLTTCLPFPHELYYDWWMAYTAACLGKLNFTKKTLVQHRRHSQNSTATERPNDVKKMRIQQLSLFKEHPLTPQATKKLITNLLDGYKDLIQKNFSLKLFFLLISHAKKICYIRRRSLFSMIRFLLKESTNTVKVN